MLTTDQTASIRPLETADDLDEARKLERKIWAMLRSFADARMVKLGPG